MMAAFAVLVCYTVFLVGVYILAEVHHCRKGNDVWDWAHKLSKWFKTKGY